MSKKIIIVGASSGIGEAMALQYAAIGHKVGITGRRTALLQNIKMQFPSLIEYECFDVTGDENIQKLEMLISKLGGLDLIVISAGWGRPSETLNWDIDKKITTTNVNGFIEIANWSFNYFVKQGHGKIAAISSVAANRGSSYSPAYAASKAFESIYCEGLSIKARKLKKEIYITCIEPGFVNTDMAHGGDKMFWIAPVEKASRQIIKAIEKKKRKVYITKRWWLIAKLMRLLPYWIYRKLG
ncbi:MAG TPA: SDR family NAD(P)-dependent oxidoreductase [Chitinophagaceae bacterium]|jgi:short-subunit dehydrogenase|nr:SDR family NAD(P)-dependent oxidoreductase [Chitinophagaceae bacterium]OPZ18601.1 MAG: putative oxidoreductase [Bacteroidetes bacterium ADurb.BinA245]HMW66789.1 SDR family NAD(P)-dependent oxidoreductase [Chitinophagaceae bacterium]HMX76992.1 SDR family NAD(P)-dependent oxidoreductase [Chitinophagaceae bacterium]HNA18827.1 SDR family NAD(P)-dependent oxidoreductase [Chitinophagaceae bacterium]